MSIIRYLIEQGAPGARDLIHLYFETKRLAREEAEAEIGEGAGAPEPPARSPRRADD